jgi:hypothetical protein
MTHIARGLDSHGALLLDVVVSGYVLQLQSPADVSVKVTCHNNFSSLFIRVRTRVQVNSP